MRRLPKNRRPTHPGQVFQEDFLTPLGITQKEAAERLRMSYPRMNLQQAVDLWDALHSDQALDLQEIEPAHVA